MNGDSWSVPSDPALLAAGCLRGTRAVAAAVFFTLLTGAFAFLTVDFFVAAMGSAYRVTEMTLLNSADGAFTITRPFASLAIL